MTESFLRMNNLGIQYLDRGEYEKAGALFRDAFDTLKGYLNTFQPVLDEKGSTTLTMSSVTTSEEQQLRRRRRRRRRPRRVSAFVHSTTSSEQTILSENDEPQKDASMEVSLTSGSKRKRKNDAAATATTTTSSPPCEETSAQKRLKLCRDTTNGEKTKTREQMTSQTPCSVEVGLLGRPLRLGPPPEKSWATMNVYATSVLYNFAYALQQAFLHLSEQDPRKEPLKRRTCQLYEVAIRLSIKGRSLVVLWLCCHNLQHLVKPDGFTAQQQITAPSERELQSKYQELEAHKTNVLRRLVGGPSDPQKMYLTVLAMLGISESPDSPAAAA